jgi:hypothetical protein
MPSEAYEAKEFTTVDSPVATYRAALTEWSDAMGGENPEWDWAEFWMVVARGNGRVPALARVFVQDWVDIVNEVGAENVADDKRLRQMVSLRVSRLRGGRAVLGNAKLLALWGGSSGASPLVYRWGTVRQLVIDIQEGLDRDVA